MAFNPYLDWLGIPLEKQPPHHYRLLAIELFEENPEIIERAADRQMSYVRSLRTGEHGQAAEQLLNEISAARLCLLADEKKTAYDQQLRRAAQRKQTAAQENRLSPPASEVAAAPTLRKAVPLPQAPAPRPVKATAVVAASAAPTAVAASSPKAKSYARRRRNNVLPLAIGLGSAAIFLAIAGLVLRSALRDDDAGRRVADSKSGQPAARVGQGVAAADGKSSSANAGESKADGAAAAPTSDDATANAADKPQPDSDPASSHHAASDDAAAIEVDAPFDAATLAAGEKVLRDRDIRFGELDERLGGLTFTRWPDGKLPAVPYQIKSSGELYLIVPPANYRDPIAADVTFPGWERTEWNCTIVVDGGAPLPCAVFRSSAQENQNGKLPVGESVWPLLAAGDVSPARIDLTALTDRDPQGELDEPPGGPREVDSSTQTTKVALPPPDAAAIAAVRARLEKQLSISALNAEERRSLAGELIAASRDAGAPAEERYVSLDSGAQMAAEAGNVDQALAAVGRLKSEFQVDALDMEFSAISRFIDATAPRSAKLEQIASILPVLDEAIQRDRYDDVQSVVAQLVKARLSTSELGERRTRAAALQKQYEADVKPALDALAANADDAEAHRVVGQFLILGKENWDEGLPHLAKGDDARLRLVAKKELADPASGRDMLSLANSWYATARERKGDERGHYLVRAENWYAKAFPSLDDVDKPQAREQLGKLQDDLDKLKWPAPPRKVTIFASSGRGVEMAINGKSVIKTNGYGIGSATVTVHPGDVILAHAYRGTPPPPIAPIGKRAPPVIGPPRDDPQRDKGFGCAIVYEGSTRAIVTGGPVWKGFVTQSAAAWKDPKYVKGVTKVQSGGSGAQQKLAERAQVKLFSIWGGTNDLEAYFYCRIP